MGNEFSNQAKLDLTRIANHTFNNPSRVELIFNRQQINELIPLANELVRLLKSGSSIIPFINTVINKYDFFQKLENAKVLDFNHLLLETPNEFAPIRISFLVAHVAIASSSVIESLDISNNNLGKYTPIILNVFAKSDSLKSIDISFNKIGSSGPAVGKVLAKFSALENVNISDNKLGSYSPATGEIMIESSSLRAVNFSSNDIEQHGPALGSALAKSLFLKNVCLGNNNLGSYAPATTIAIANSDSIEYVDISLNKLGSYARAAVEGFAKSLSIKKINISHNELGPDHGPLAISALTKLSSIEQINIGYNTLETCRLEITKIILESGVIYRIDTNELNCPETFALFHKHNSYVDELNKILGISRDNTSKEQINEDHIVPFDLEVTKLVGEYVCQYVIFSDMIPS